MLLTQMLELVRAEYIRSVNDHGDWSDYTLDQMMAVIINELMVEAGGAEERGDILGEHGVIRELLQVSATSMKGAMVLMIRHKLLAGASRPEGAHSGSTGRSLPASPSIPQDKESCSNSPEEVSHGTR